MKKNSSESEAVPTVSINLRYFIKTKFMLFYRRNPHQPSSDKIT